MPFTVTCQKKLMKAFVDFKYIDSDIDILIYRLAIALTKIANFLCRHYCNRPSRNQLCLCTYSLFVARHKTYLESLYRKVFSLQLCQCKEKV